MFLANGFEEIEAITTLDILRRLGLEVKTITITGARLIRGAHGIPVMADGLFRKSDIDTSEGLILPGGMPGASNLFRHEGLRKELLQHNERGTVIAAICAAPMILGRNGLLEGRRATCYPGFEKYLEGAECTGETVTCDGHIITGRGPAAAVPFAMAIGGKFVDAAKIEALQNDMCFRHE